MSPFEKFISEFKIIKYRISVKGDYNYSIQIQIGARDYHKKMDYYSYDMNSDSTETVKERIINIFDGLYTHLNTPPENLSHPLYFERSKIVRKKLDSLTQEVMALVLKIEESGEIEKTRKEHERLVIIKSLKRKLSEYFVSDGTDEELASIINEAKTESILKS